MKKFSNLKPTDNITANPKKTLFKDPHLTVVNYENISIITDRDVVVCIPYLIQQNKIIVRQEYVPAYKYADGQDLHICLVGGGIEKGETPEEALLRELQEEAGIVVRPNFKIEMEKPLFMFKGSSCKYFMSILTLTENDYHEIAVDKSKEHRLDTAAKIDVKYVNSLNVSDVVTELMLEKFKKYANL
jgi:8-oxo-dGTP pyrophosphatase MutT (NUDIX family)